MNRQGAKAAKHAEEASEGRQERCAGGLPPVALAGPPGPALGAPPSRFDRGTRVHRQTVRQSLLVA